MAKHLVIVESPAKAKTINKYLGKDYIVKSSVGHIRDLPTAGSSTRDSKSAAEKAKATREDTANMNAAQKAKYKAKKSHDQLIARMGVDPEHNWAAKYQVLPGKEKVVAELKKLAKDAESIYLATDLDREGEAIAWHLTEAIGGDMSRYRRVVFNEITKTAIAQAFEAPGEVDMHRVEAQQARRFLDRVVGFMVSPLLWKKIARGLSAGRVQSVAVRLVVERERSIRAFVPEEYWEIAADLVRKGGEQVRFQVKRDAEGAFRPTSKDAADVALNALNGAQYSIAQRDDKPTKSKPSAPFITSTLQQAASTRLGFSVKKTMTLAQRLYEAGHITYMRTDSTNLSAEAVASCRDYIADNFGNAYLPENPMRYGAKEGAQEAHEAIRPSNVKVTQTQLSEMERDAQRLYAVIWNQFVACQMMPATYLSSSVEIQAGDYVLRTKGRVVTFDGYTRVLPSMSKREDDQELPDFKVGEPLDLSQLLPTQHFTNPPPRFTEASLVKELEKKGIGRPSTYAAIISTIQDRGYAKVENRRFYAEKMGDIVTDRLVESFDDLLSYDFTARMESDLDKVADGDKSWLAVLNEFYAGFTKTLTEADSAEDGMRANDPTMTSIECPTCSRPMQIRTASTGVFLGCSGYSLPPKERCKTTINLIPGDEAESVDSDEAETEALRAKHRCPICTTAMESYLIDEKRKLHVCGNNPDCSGFEIEQGAYKLKGYDGPVLECDRCTSEMQLKNGRFGKYFDCTNSECKNTRKLLKSGEAAPPKMDPVPMPELACLKVDDVYVLRDGASGLFLAASKFPKNRETRAPLVSELKPHKDEIDKKYHFLMSAPVKDPEGNPTIVRFSRKNKAQYVQSEINGKASGWKAEHLGGKWVESGKVKDSLKAKK